MGMKLYKVFSLVSTLVGGLLAAKMFQQVWRRAVHEDDAPRPTDEERRWKEILTAAAVQGAVAGLLKAVLARGGAVGMRRATGTWPG